MKQTCTLFALVCLLAGHASAQDFAQQYLLRADSLYDAEDYPAAAVWYDSARVRFEQKADWNSALKSTISLGYALDDMGQTEQTIGTYLRYLKTIASKPGIDSFLVAKVHSTLGFSYKKMERYSSALASYETAIAIYEAIRANHSNVAYAYRGAAQIYQRRLELDKAVSYLEKALGKDSTFALQATLHMLLCGVNLDLENYDEVVRHYHLGIGLAKRPRDAATLKSMGGKAYFKLGDFATAETLIKSAINDTRSNPELELELWIDLKNLAEIYTQKGQLAEAEKQYKLALADAQKTYPNKNRELAKVCTEFGDFYFAQQKTDAALTLYQQAIVQVFPDFNSLDISKNPTTAGVYAESWIMTATAKKGTALLKRAGQSGSTADLKNAADCLDLTLAAIAALKEGYGSDYAKLYLGDYTHAYFEAAIAANFVLFEKNGDQRHLEKTFAIMEQSKASVLAEGIQKNRALILAGLPADLLDREQELRLQLAETNLALRAEALLEQSADPAELADLRSKMADQQREYEALLANLKKNHPAFRQYLERPGLPSIAQVQAYLSEKNAALLEYFMGGEHLYLVVLTATGADVFRVGRGSGLDGQLENFLQFFQNSGAILNDMDGFAETSHALYQLLFPEKIRTTLPARLLILPDGALSFVPFDALLTEASGGNGFARAAYLLRKHQVGFAYSAGLLLRPAPAISRQGGLLHVSPLFAAGERGLAPLNASKDGLSGLGRTKNLTGKNATLAQFLKWAPASQLIHLFTHAGVGSGAGGPRIEFIDTSLYLPSLYALNLPAGLVVLSACETGLGEHARGEGVMSLARGFAYAGAANLAASLWRVNEQSTAQLFERFFGEIKAGEGKAAALREAKIWYLENAGSDARRSPYYWAGFVMIGDDEPMEFAGPGVPGWAWAAGGAAILLALFGFAKWRKINRATLPAGR